MLTTQTKQAWAKCQAEHLLRTRQVITQKTNVAVQVNGHELINFCSNDYLNLSTHPEVITAYQDAVAEFGLGSGASALVSGYSRWHQALENAFADFLQRERALLFTSGYHANLGILTALAKRDSIIIMDKSCHASLIDGALLSRATLWRYQHNDMQQAENLLKKAVAKSSDIFLVSESVFSIRGNLAPLSILSALAKKYHAHLLIDEAHGIGILGQHGQGACEHLALTNTDAPCVIVPFGKAVGSLGAIVAGSHELIETLIQFAHTYRCSTALPPAICAGTLTALKILQQESWRRARLQQLIRFFCSQARQYQLTLATNNPTAIQSIVIGDNKLTLAIQQQLQQQGFLVACIRPPTVPINQACLRITLNVAHTETHITALLNAIRNSNE